MFFTPENQPAELKHNPLNAIVVPRPIGWISTLDQNGRANLAPYSLRSLFITVIFCLFAAPTFAGGLRGIVTDGEDGQPLPGVTILLANTQQGAITDTSGAYAITSIPEGTYTVEAHLMGYRLLKQNNIYISLESSFNLNFTLQPDILSLEEIVVTPGRFAVLKKDPVASQSLSREEIQSIPQFGDDIYRAISRLPGVTGSDFSSRFTIRGGEHDQVLVTLDGLELIDPFHMKDVEGGGLSIIDSEVIGGIDMITGGFPADYGDKQSAVMEMTSADPRPGRRFSAGVGLATARLFGEGGNEHLGWLVSARRGYVDLVLKLMNEDDNFRPLYYDIFGKLAFKNNDRHQFSLNVLWASDDLTYLDKEEDDYEFFSAYQNAYTWLVWNATLGPTLHARTLPYIGHITTNRLGNTFRTTNRVLHEQVDDARTTTLYGIKSDWAYQPHKNHLLRFGFDIKRQTADYDYYRREQIARTAIERVYDTIRVATQATNTKYSAYIADKLRLAGPLTADIGLRIDHQSHTDENQLSPRLALALPVGNSTVLRAAWGRYYQSQSPDDLDVQYNVQTFRTPERATHYILGIEHKLPNNTLLRYEGYYKDLDNIHDRFEDVQNEIELMPELHSDIAQLFPETGSIRGLEFFLKRDSGGRFNWWASYTLSQARETHSNQGSFPQVYGQTYPQKRDQRHQFALDLIYRPSPNWNISAAWQYRTGWPHTAILAVPTQNGGTSIQYVNLYDDHYPAYHRIDINLIRTFTFQSWRLRTSIGVINLYNRRNVRSYIYDWNGPEQGLIRTNETWFPRLPSFTFSAEF